MTRKHEMADQLLEWYRVNARQLPWRAAPGARADPYRVWLSEIMLQQTTVRVVIPYFEKFLASWPTAADLAAAPLHDILTAWAGLGYYARARNLHACAKQVVARFGGRFPETEAELLELPGIGPYTAAALLAIAFNARACAVDGNVERVMARLYGITTPLPDAKPELRLAAQRLVPDREYGDYAQAVMELGALICTPRSPACHQCPWAGPCKAAGLGDPGSLPRRARRKDKPHRFGTVFWLETGDGYVLTRTRPEKGLLGGMAEIPSTPWLENAGGGDISGHAPLETGWLKLPARVQHTFTHFHLTLDVWCQRLERRRGAGLDGSDWIWARLDRLEDFPFPSVMRKVIALARAGQSAV